MSHTLCRESSCRKATVPVTLDDVRELALSLPRSYEAVVRGRVKFRVGQIVYLAFSHDRETMGFGFPKELRDALVQSEPHKFSLPSQSDMRFNWVDVRLAAIDADEMCDLVEGAWAMCVPKRVAQLLRETEAHRLPVVGKRQVDDLADPELHAPAYDRLVAARKALRELAHIVEGHGHGSPS